MSSGLGCLIFPSRDSIKKKPTSRWDTPSPSFDQNPRLTPQYSSPVPNSGPGRGRELDGNRSDDGGSGWSGGYGRGRGGKRKKKNRKKGGKNNKCVPVCFDVQILLHIVCTG